MRAIVLYHVVPVVFFSTAKSATRGIGPIPIMDEKGNQVPLHKESHALIIGVGEYSHWPSLPGVNQDIQSVKQTLENHSFHTRLYSNSNFANLIESIDNFNNENEHDPDNRLLFYFAGHGHTLKLAYGEKI